jgi:HK97 family phage major capsid protein
MPTIQELKEQRVKLVTDARDLSLTISHMEDKAKAAETRTKVDAMLADADILAADITTAEKIAQVESELRSTVRPPRGTPEAGDAEKAGEMRAFEHYFRTGEKRDLLTTSSATGGAIIPQLYNQNVIDATKYVGQMINVVGKKVTNNNGAPIKIATSNDNANILVTLGEGSQLLDTTTSSPPTNSDPTFGGFLMYTDTIATLVKVSLQELDDASFDLASWLRTKFGIRYARGLEQYITLGNSSNIASVVSGATLGATSATAGTVVYDDFTACYSALDPSYEANASWVMSSTTRSNVMGLVDGLGRPLFIPNPNSGVLDHILGRPIVLNQSLPSAYVAGNAGILYGDFAQGYLLRTDGDMSFVRLNERYMDTLEVGFVAYTRVGGASTDAGTHPILKLVTHS